MSNRKQIRDWFKQALSPHRSRLGEVFPVRVVEFKEGQSLPDVFTNVYISEGEIREGEGGLAGLTYMQVEIGFHMKHGKDDDLDLCETVAEKAIASYELQRPPPFSFYKTGFSYAGDSEDAYEQLYLTFQLVIR